MVRDPDGQKPIKPPAGPDPGGEPRPEEGIREPSVGMTPDEASLTTLVKRSLGWNAILQIFTRVMSLVSGVLLARILDPNAFGLNAVAVTAVPVLAALNDLGLIMALVHYKRDPREVAPTINTLTLVTSLLLYGLCWIGAPAFASLMGSPEATGLVRFATVTIVFDGIASVPIGMLLRNLQAHRMAIAQFVAAPLSFVLTLTLALQGYGAWSLAWGHVVGNLVAGITMFVLAPARGRLTLRLRETGSLLRYGLPVVGAGVVEATLLNVDYFLVGRFLGPVALGFYVLAFNISNWPVSFIAGTIRTTAVAGFARLGDDRSRLTAGFARSWELLVALTLPTVVLLAMLAEPLIRVVYGGKWADSVPALQLLAILGGTRVLTLFMSDVLIALAGTRRAFALNVLWLALLVPALVLATQSWGIRGTAAAHVLVAGPVMLPLFLKAIGGQQVDLSGLFRRIGRPLLGSALMVVVLLTASAAIADQLMRLLLGGAAAGSIYLAINYPVVSSLLKARRQGAAEERDGKI